LAADLNLVQLGGLHPVAQDSSQRPNITFCETFAPVFKITLIRVLSAFALLDKAGPEDLCVRRHLAVADINRVEDIVLVLV
jgi:hypothetical protein